MGGIIVPMSVFWMRLSLWVHREPFTGTFGVWFDFSKQCSVHNPLSFPIKAKWLVIGYVILELGLGIRQNAADNVAHCPS